MSQTLPAAPGETGSDLRKVDFRALFERFPDAVVVTDRWAAGRSLGWRWGSSSRPASVMHAIYAHYALNGRFLFDILGFSIDSVGVPAAAYFLWVVHGLFYDTLDDWSTVESGPRS